MKTPRRQRMAIGLAGFALLLMANPGGTGGVGETLAVVKDGELVSNAELAVRLSEATPLGSTAPRVLLSRDDGFADALSSGALQADSRLLLTPSRGLLPTRVQAEIRRLAATSAIVLGGPSAVEEEIVEQVRALGLTVTRYAGASRVETAIEVARAEFPDATTVLLARAFAASDAPESQAFADTMGAGALAAERGWPVLLTTSESLSPATAAYLQSSPVSRVLVLGGTAALHPQVEEDLRALGLEVQRVAGGSRFATAVEVAKAGGHASAAELDRVVLVAGEGEDAWAGGLAAANHSAHFDAPILLVGDGSLAPEVTAYLDGGSGTTDVTCVARPFSCEAGRRELGLPSVPYVRWAVGQAEVPDGGIVELVVSPPEAVGSITRLEVDGNPCTLEEAPDVPPTAPGHLPYRLNYDSGFAGPPPPPPPGSGPGGNHCAPFFQATFDSGRIVGGQASYSTPGSGTLSLPPVLFVELYVLGDPVMPQTPMPADVTATCTGEPDYVEQVSDRLFAGVRPDIADLPPLQAIVGHNVMEVFPSTTDWHCDITVSPIDGHDLVHGVFSYYDDALSDPLLQGNGPVASVGTAALPDSNLSLARVLFFARPTTERPQGPRHEAASVEVVLSDRVYRLSNVVNSVVLTCDDGPVELEPRFPGARARGEVRHGASCTAEVAGEAAEDPEPRHVAVSQVNTETMVGERVDFTVDAADGTIALDLITAAAGG